MPALYRARHLSLYPLGMDAADYLVISGTASNGKVVTVSGATSYLGQEKMDALNQCLLQRSVDNDFVLYKDIPAIGLLIFKHMQNDLSDTKEE